MKIIRTKPVRGPGGKIVKDPGRVRRILYEQDTYKVKDPCRVCGGTRKYLDGSYTRTCLFCDENGPKYGCGDCGEVLPMCRCVRESNFAREVRDDQGAE